jgi:hypothetical protein
MIDTKARFPFLSSSFHLSYYFTRKSGINDVVSESLLKFKDNEYPDTERWIKKASKELPKFISGIDVILRVLGSDELDANDGYTSLDELCESLELALEGSEYMPNVLKKTDYTNELKYMSKADRLSELEDVYYIDNSDELEGKTILLVDDILTTGSTLKSIMKSLEEEVCDFSLHFFTLGKTYDKFTDIDANNLNVERDILTGDPDNLDPFDNYEGEEDHLIDDKPPSILNPKKLTSLEPKWDLENLKDRSVPIVSKKKISIEQAIKKSNSSEELLKNIRKNNAELYNKLQTKDPWVFDIDKYKIPEQPVYRPSPPSDGERNFGCIILIIVAIFYAIILNNC